MKGLVFFGPGDMRFQEYDIPIPKPDEALVRVISVSICGSDIHIYQDGHVGPYIIKEPLILGHECSGEIIEVGSNVRNLSAGDRVIFEPGYPWGKCWYCRHDKYLINHIKREIY
ncbi:alcohol dehydrogenase catalytic domain-containing protein [candidate division WOR-3 bacterium]|nr:alcohol dehydrogenase catalytic domain-containing protein [candidate division WOR-3 bacterium]